MKIYTKTGDDGTTGLIGGKRAIKCDCRIECIGRVDELNAAIGLAMTVSSKPLARQLRNVQNDLFVLGSHLAVGAGKTAASRIPPITEQMVGRLEKEIDACDARLAPLRNFILPGGSESAARLHMARAICRNAERCVVDFGQKNSLPPLAVIYLNRLSDWLFVMARGENQRRKIADIPWRPAKAD
jgi:cob(I)alamin adenosyltransferase